MVNTTYTLYADTPEEVIAAMIKRLEIMLDDLNKRRGYKMGFSTKRAAKENADEIFWCERELRFLRSVEIDTKLNAKTAA